MPTRRPAGPRRALSDHQLAVDDEKFVIYGNNTLAVTRAAVDLLHLAKEYYGSDPESDKAQGAVLAFVQHVINNDERSTPVPIAEQQHPSSRSAENELGHPATALGRGQQ